MFENFINLLVHNDTPLEVVRNTKVKNNQGMYNEAQTSSFGKGHNHREIIGRIFLPVRNFGIQRFYKKNLDRVISDKEEV